MEIANEMTRLLNKQDCVAHCSSNHQVSALNTGLCKDYAELYSMQNWESTFHTQKRGINL